MSSEKWLFAYTVWMSEVADMALKIRLRVLENNGADYLQVFKSTRGRTIFCIDQLNREMKESGEFKKEDDHWTIMLNHEY